MKKLAITSLFTVLSLLFLAICLLPKMAVAQGNWTQAEIESLKRSNLAEPIIQAHNATYFTIDFQSVYDAILAEGAGLVIDVPTNAGTTIPFKLVENSTMSAGLKAKFPEIVAYNIVSTQNHSTWGKITISPKGIYAMYQVPGSRTVFVDPVFENNTSAYVLYTRENYISTKSFECLVAGSENEISEKAQGMVTPYNDCEIKTYRLAIAATGEYSGFHGSTTALAMAAIVTTINRVNMVYEREFGVTLELIENNDLLVYLNQFTDPYSNGDPLSMIAENQTNINDVIGFSNYDIGHVFGTNSGGLAGLGVVCGSFKARGVTGSGAPIGDAFDIDYVAHEMGHQFGGAHTFNNSCQGHRNNATAMEPGSGTTIMAYAGICSPDIQNNSDDYFHGVSMSQIGIEIESHNCAVVTPITNASPQLTFATTEVVLPILTPFALNAQGTDVDTDDVLTYCWEQMDNNISTQPPVSSSAFGPNFRSFDPTTNSTRYFPQLEALANSASQTWERLPSVTREMEFRVTLRDNAPGAGCTDYANSSISFVSSAGPFLVMNPNTSDVVWDAFTIETVTWDVANTASAPISAALVDIYLSVDGGASYPITLIENVPNTGSANISVPNNITSTARVMVMNDAGTFFDISDADFTITGVTTGFYIEADEPNIMVCAGDNFVFDITANAVGDFDSPITLALSEELAVATATFGTSTLLPGESTTLTISNTNALDIGELNLLVIGSSNGETNELPLVAGINATDASTPSLLLPENNADFNSTDVVFSWTLSDSPTAVYHIEVATNPDFSNIVSDIEGIDEATITVAGLEPETTYYWRVQAETLCGSSDISEFFSFSTHTCFEFESLDVPKNIPSSTANIISEIEVLSSGVLTDVNVINIMGVHSRVSDLIFELESPQGTFITLLSNACGSNNNFNLGFDDAGVETVDCPPTSGSRYQPEELLETLNGQDSEGIWKLRIQDQELGAGGSLDAWSLQLCFANGSSFILTTNETEVNICQNGQISFDVTAQPVFEYTDSITLSAVMFNNMSVSFDPEVVLPGESSTVTVIADAASMVGSFTQTITGNSNDLIYDLEIPTNVNEESPEAANLISPDNSITLSSALVTFQWSESESPASVYGLEIAYDVDFTEMLNSYYDLLENEFTYSDLPPVDVLYWRVRTNNGCDESVSDVNSFNTGTCYIDAPIDLPVNISAGANTYSSEIDVPFTGNVQSVSVSALSGLHARVGDLSARLVSPSGTIVELFADVCGSDDDFNLAFADGGIAEIDCPPVTGLQYAPLESFTAFAGEEANGIWTLELQDSQSGAGGSFENWALEVCFEDDVFGLADANQYKLNIFPNPASDMVTIGFESGSGVELIRLYDVSGRQLISTNVTNRDMVELDLSKFASGVYFIRATGSEGSSSFKLVKEN